MSEYLVLIYGDEAAAGKAGPEAMSQLMKEHNEFAAGNGAALRGGQALHPTDSATSVRKDSTGAFSVTDGAFAETKEALSGFYVVEAADMDEALAIAKQVPAPFGGVEVRPIMVFS